MVAEPKITEEQLANLVSGVSAEDKESLVAYCQAKRRLKRMRGSMRFSTYTEENRSSDQFVTFTLARTARRTHKKIFKAMLDDLMLDSELLAIGTDFHAWEIISSKRDPIKHKINLWTHYLNIAQSMYVQVEDNESAGNSLFKMSFYQADKIPMLPIAAGWYNKNGERITDKDKKVRAVFDLGYLMTMRRAGGIVRPKAANRHDIELLTKLIGFYESNAVGGGSGLRGDIQNTIKRFSNNYLWPNKQLLDPYARRY
jgi:hypothetical protein